MLRQIMIIAGLVVLCGGDGAAALAQDATAQAAACPSCKAALKPGAKFCTNCGTKIELAPRAVCVGCGAALAPGAKFCTGCGHKVDAAAAHAAPAVCPSCNQPVKPGAKFCTGCGHKLDAPPPAQDTPPPDAPPDTEPETPPADADDDEEKLPRLTLPDTPDTGVRTVMRGKEFEEFRKRPNLPGANLARHGLDAVLTLTPPAEGGRALERLNDGDLVYYVQLKQSCIEVALPRVPRVALVAVAYRYAFVKGRVVLEERAADGTWQVLAAASGIDERNNHLCMFALEPAPRAALRVWTETAEPHYIAEIFVQEEAYEDPARSCLSSGGVDIAMRENGGCVFFGPRNGGSFSGFLNRNPYYHGYVPPVVERGDELVFTFAANEEALVRAVAIEPAVDSRGTPNLTDYPTAVHIAASLHNPFDDFDEAGTFPVVSRGGKQRFAFDPPLRARFLRIGLDAAPEASQIRLGSVVIEEGTAPGYASVLLRAAPLAQSAADRHAIETLLPGLKAALEVEPNDTLEDATVLETAAWVRGSFQTPADRDTYRFTLNHAAAQIPELEMHMAPFLRARAKILDTKGAVVMDVDPTRTGGTSLATALSVDPGDYFLQLEVAPIYVVLGFDASGSMGGTFRTTQEAVTTWVASLPEGFHVALATSLEDSKTSLPYTVFCPFTTDATQIAATVRTMFRDGGSSDWYDVLGGLVAYGDEHIPRDTIGAIVFMADGNGAGDFFMMWDALRRSRMRLYTIGFGDVGEDVDADTSWDGARGLFNTAWFRNGRYFEPHSLKDLVEVYGAIFEDLKTPPEYALRLTVRPRREGTLASAAPPGENRPTLFILDCSGSMLAEMGASTRWDIAKQVVVQIIGSLPDSSQVGLRAYGHRFTTLEREKAATDSELLIPVKALDRAVFAQTVHRLRARGGTPLAHSLEQARADVKDLARPRVVLITDGVEMFRRDPVEQAAALAASVPGLELAIVGFGIGLHSDQEGLRAMAAAAGGAYYNATDAASLVASIMEAISPTVPYTLADLAGRPVLEGKLGGVYKVPEGRYTAVFTRGSDTHRLDVVVLPDRTTRIENPFPPEKPQDR